ncbi:hypothetical protein L798_00728 [Zootermopsis nevadensis]|uniref:Uncharacterized protein n=1 Tax=Zootermopsis nevadensis TaxID=136037 RepID=A0A067RSM2_ZOONE|nr:hypothetical protein L798_00728 [Zootermopsis nevadensis]
MLGTQCYEETEKATRKPKDRQILDCEPSPGPSNYKARMVTLNHNNA